MELTRSVNDFFLTEEFNKANDDTKIDLFVGQIILLLRQASRKQATGLTDIQLAEFQTKITQRLQLTWHKVSEDKNVEPPSIKTFLLYALDMITHALLVLAAEHIAAQKPVAPLGEFSRN